MKVYWCPIVDGINKMSYNKWSVVHAWMDRWRNSNLNEIDKLLRTTGYDIGKITKNRANTYVRAR